MLVPSGCWGKKPYWTVDMQTKRILSQYDSYYKWRNNYFKELIRRAETGMGFSFTFNLRFKTDPVPPILVMYSPTYLRSWAMLGSCCRTSPLLHRVFSERYSSECFTGKYIPDMYTKEISFLWKLFHSCHDIEFLQKASYDIFPSYLYIFNDFHRKTANKIRT